MTVGREEVALNRSTRLHSRSRRTLGRKPGSVSRSSVAEMVGEALLAKAQGAGHRTIAVRLGRPPATVRGWLRAFARRSEAVGSCARRWAHAIDAMMGGAGGGAVKVAALPLPSLRSVTGPAVRRDPLPKSSEEGGLGFVRVPVAGAPPPAQNPGGSRGRPCSSPVSATASSHGEAWIPSSSRHARAAIPSASTASTSGGATGWLSPSATPSPGGGTSRGDLIRFFVRYPRLWSFCRPPPFITIFSDAAITIFDVR